MFAEEEDVKAELFQPTNELEEVGALGYRSYLSRSATAGGRSEWIMQRRLLRLLT
jgi:hypothetical protein